MTYSEQLVDDYPMLTRGDVERILREHGFGFDTPTLGDVGSFDDDFEMSERYRSADVMTWLGY